MLLLQLVILGIVGLDRCLLVQALPSRRALIGPSSEAEIIPQQWEARRTPSSAESKHDFLNPFTAQFLVDGTGIPDVDFDVGQSFAGLLPISDHANETRKLFFWFFPSSDPDVANDLTIWLNGGPGCSSLVGLLQENGPFLWQPGTEKPIRNPYSWHQLTHMVWIDQPIGTGFSQGKPNIRDEIGLSRQFLGFYNQFATSFGLEDFNVYLTGESYAGKYVPYVADAFIRRHDPCYFNLKGIAINDPFIGDSFTQQVIPMLPFTRANNNILNINSSVLATVEAIQCGPCGWQAILDKYLAFPPPGKIPSLGSSVADLDSCNTYDPLIAAATDANPCYSWDDITIQCPMPYSVIGQADDQGPPSPADNPYYFDRADVKRAIHAPIDCEWVACHSSLDIFPDAVDSSPPPATNGVLQRVIEHTNNVIIGNGDWDMLLPTNGTLLALQNVTWNGKQGLQKWPGKPFTIPPGNGPKAAGREVVGSWGAERGVTFYQVRQAGHELPA